MCSVFYLCGLLVGLLVRLFSPEDIQPDDGRRSGKPYVHIRVKKTPGRLALAHTTPAFGGFRRNTRHRATRVVACKHAREDLIHVLQLALQIERVLDLLARNSSRDFLVGQH